ncbi:MFS transporter [Arthrobacter koreensis]|uniref:MFS transporter n=1 Tax=Arthrobacter koreensis TaxID=199136 RepID=UPI0036DDD2DB
MSRASRVVVLRACLAESAPDGRREFFGSFLKFGTTVAFILAAIVCTTTITLVGDEGKLEGWWRLPFLLTIPLGLTALWIRTRLVEAPVFAEASAQKETRSPRCGRCWPRTGGSCWCWPGLWCC